MSRQCPTCLRTYPRGATKCLHDGTSLVDAPVAGQTPPEPGVDEAASAGPQPYPEAAVSVPPTRSAKPDAASTPSDNLGSKARRILAGLFASESPVPPVEREKGWSTSGGSTRGPAFTSYPLVNADGRQAVLLLYRDPGALTTDATYRQVLLATGLPAVGLITYGATSNGDRQQSYEIVEPPTGRSLASWINDFRGEDAAGFLAPKLLNLLQGLRSRALRALSLDPSLVWIDEGGNAILIALGALTAASGEEFHDYLGSSPLLPPPWRAPEMEGRMLSSQTGDIFSVAQIIASVRFREPFSHDDLREGLVPFQEIANDELRRLLMGTLWPKAEGRWDFASISEPNAMVPAWDSLRKGAAANSFSLGGVAYWHAPDLLRAASANWDEAIQHFPALLAWLEGTPFAADARAVAASGSHTADWQLVRLCRVIVPAMPPFWRDFAFNDSNVDTTLVQLAQTILAEAGVDNTRMTAAGTAAAYAEALFAADLRGSFAPGTGRPHWRRPPNARAETK